MSLNVLLVLGHPRSQSFNGALLGAYRDAAIGSGAEVRTIELAELRFDPLLSLDPDQALEPDLQAARRDIEWADHVVWFFPVWWGGAPALLKGFIDRTFLPGWAYNTADNGMPIKHLKGRTSRTVITMDAPGWFYRFWYGRAAHRAMERATLWFCGLDVIGRTTVTTLKESTAAQRADLLAQIAKSARKDVARQSRKPELALNPS